MRTFLENILCDCSVLWIEPGRISIELVRYGSIHNSLKGKEERGRDKGEKKIEEKREEEMSEERGNGTGRK